MTTTEYPIKKPGQIPGFLIFKLILFTDIAEKLRSA